MTQVLDTAADTAALEPHTCDVETAADILYMSVARLEELCGTGTIAAHRDRNGNWAITLDELQRVLEERKVDPNKKPRAGAHLLSGDDT